MTCFENDLITTASGEMNLIGPFQDWPAIFQRCRQNIRNPESVYYGRVFIVAELSGQGFIEVENRIEFKVSSLRTLPWS